jgi:hypothetical protein
MSADIVREALDFGEARGLRPSYRSAFDSLVTDYEDRVKQLEAERDWALEVVVSECGGTVEDALEDARAQIEWEKKG